MNYKDADEALEMLRAERKIVYAWNGKDDIQISHKQFDEIMDHGQLITNIGLYWVNRAKQAEFTLNDHGPEGHNFTNQRVQELRERAKQLEAVTEAARKVFEVHCKNCKAHYYFKGNPCNECVYGPIGRTLAALEGGIE